MKHLPTLILTATAAIAVWSAGRIYEHTSMRDKEHNRAVYEACSEMQAHFEMRAQHAETDRYLLTREARRFKACAMRAEGGR